MIQYDVAYYQNLLRIQTLTAKQICSVRWDFVLQLLPELQKHPVVLDYGCGVGWFAAYKPVNFIVDTYDIMPVPQSGILHEKYDILTLWDVLEHIPDFTDLGTLFNNTDFLVMTLPIKPDGMAWKNYKHFKPSEHLHYYDEPLLCAMFDKFGFDLEIRGTPECPPREHVSSFIFKKRNLA